MPNALELGRDEIGRELIAEVVESYESFRIIGIAVGAHFDHATTRPARWVLCDSGRRVTRSGVATTAHPNVRQCRPTT